MRVFADFHHSGLLHSLIMLFEGRFGGELYRPIGTEWHTAGFWKIYDHPATVEQYLGINGATPDGTPPLNNIDHTEWVGANRENDTTYKHPVIYHCQDIDSGLTNKAITLEGFMATKFDLVIASIPAHIAPFRDLCDKHPNAPKLVFQVGNSWDITDEQAAMLDGVMASAMIPMRGTVLGRNGKPLPVVIYHQEFDLDLFKPSEGYDDKVTSFINCLNVAHHHFPDWMLFTELEKHMPEYKFQSFGGQCRDGSKNGAKEVAEEMRKAKFVFHVKSGGDGYGHILHNAFACGKPVIIRRSDYVGKLGDVLLKDGETAIFVDGLTSEQVANKIRIMSGDCYDCMSRKVRKAFDFNVNFDTDAQNVMLFLEMISS